MTVPHVRRSARVATKNNTKRRLELSATAAAATAAAPSQPKNCLALELTVSNRDMGSISSSVAHNTPFVTITPSPAKKQKKAEKGTKRTESFPPLTCASFPDLAEKSTPVHTLILGSHPSVKSLEANLYYAHSQNALWWIVGDCLGFRRASGVSTSTGKEFALCQHLRHSNDHVIPSPIEQQKELVKHGFALWDVVQSCHRPGSLDQDIRDDVPNDLPAFVAEHHPHLKRIILSNGITGSKLLLKHWKGWMLECSSNDKGNADSNNTTKKFVAGRNDEPSQQVFAKFKVDDSSDSTQGEQKADTAIELYCALSVSPAAARHSYVEKRDWWEKHVFAPGLRDYHLTRKQV